MPASLIANVGIDLARQASGGADHLMRVHDVVIGFAPREGNSVVKFVADLIK